MNFPHSLVLLKAGDYQRDGSGHVVQDTIGWPEEQDETPLVAFKGWLQPSPTLKRVRNIASGEVLADDGSGMAWTSHLLYAPIGTPILKRDRIRKDPDDGLFYVVANDPEDAGGRGHHLEVDLVEYRLGAAAA